MTLSYTRRFRFGIPDFNSGPWHADFERMVQKIDAVLYNQLQATAVTWTNSTVYVLDDFVISPVDGTMWSCAVAHTSSASPTTFSGERILHPTYWNSFLGDASDIPFTPAGGLLSTDVQSALAELGILKANLSAISSIGASGATVDAIASVGVWTPVFSCATPGDLAVTYSVQLGEYFVIGNLVRLKFNITSTAGGLVWTTASGNIRITGIPFNAAIMSVVERGPVAFSGFTKANYTQMSCNIASAGTNMALSAAGSAQANTPLVIGDFPSGGTLQLVGNIWYFKA